MKTILTTNLFRPLLAGLLLLGATSAQAAWEFSANFGATTDYVFRGISQGNEEAAPSAGLDWSHSSGFYVGTWVSTVDQVELRGSSPDNTDVEHDIYAGIGGNFTDAFSWDIGAIYYAYWAASQLNFYEVYGSLSYDFGVASVTGGVAYSPDFFGETDNALYYYVEGEIPLPYDFAIGLHYGHQDIKDNSVFGTPDYDEWKVGVSKAYKNVTFDLSYTDTDLSNAKCFGGSDLCEGRAVFSVGVDF
jgi:uncharacterized protein (TIGR02001 family)